MTDSATAASGPTPKGRVALGIVFISVGVIIALDSAGVFRWWALLLIGLGVLKLRQPTEDGQRATGMGLLVLGIFFQAQGLFAWAKAWPLMLVLFGAFLVWQSLERKPLHASAASDHSTLSEVVLMGGMKRTIHTPAFRGGYLTVMMGGIEIDLRSAKIDPASPAVIDVFVMWGGIDIKVPPEWRVDLEAVPFMGGFESKSKTPPHPESAPRLVVRGTAIMGGAVIQN
jgi:hypothetical protein